MTPDTAAPILPSRDLGLTAGFYERLGFAVRRDAHEPYLIAVRGGWELHFFLQPDLDPYATAWMCFLWAADAAALYADWQRLGLPAAGVPRLQWVGDDTARGFREFAVVDPGGNLVRVGSRLPAG